MTTANRIDPRTLSQEVRRQAGLPDFDDPEDRLRLQKERAHEKVRSDGSLSPKAATQAHARIEKDARARMRELEKRAGEERTRQLATATRKAFGVDDLIGSGDGATVRADHRSALARADAIGDGAEAAKALQRALDLGDEVFARAIGHRAFSKSQGLLGTRDWAEVLATFTEARPGRSEAIETLLTPVASSGSNALFRYVLPSAPELVSKVTRSQANDHQLEALASGLDVDGFGS